MNRRIVGLLAVMGLVLAGSARAAEMKQAAKPAVPRASEPVKVDNKICPISGHKVGEMGKAKTVEYKGKVYNLCCSMCEKDFLKDPEAAIKKIEEGMESEAEGSAEDAAEDAAEGHHEHDHAK